MQSFFTFLQKLVQRSASHRAIAIVMSLVLVGAILFVPTTDALAARSGGRIGGGSFRAPSRSYSAPSRSRGYSSGGGYRGGGMGFPLILPFFGFGGFSGIVGIFAIIVIANIIMNAVRNVGGGGGSDSAIYQEPDPQVGIAQVQVGLLASARELQKDLDELALSADTGTNNGRMMVLQEATLALLRHPEYWVYGSCQSDNARMSVAEAAFNQLALTERSKFSDETLSNYNNQLRQASPKPALSGDGAELPDAEGEYILVTLVVAALGQLRLPNVNDAADLKRVLQSLGGIGSDRLVAIEVLWTPQKEGEVLTRDDIISEYPELKLV